MPEDSGESSLTTTENEIITELQKILLTLNQINESLGKTIALTKEDGEMVKAHREATETGAKFFSFEEPGEAREGG